MSFVLLVAVAIIKETRENPGDERDCDLSESLLHAYSGSGPTSKDSAAALHRPRDTHDDPW
jgi:hypothetical protein